MGNDLKLFQLTPTPNPSLIREGCMHTTNCRRKRKTAFTLAEVLITLGIIGVVAALTIPTVITNYKKSQIEARLKKLYTVMNQAVMLSKAHDTWTQPPTDKRYDNVALNNWLQSALYPYLTDARRFYKKGTDPDYPIFDTSDYGITLSDGTILVFENSLAIHVFADINGLKGPNKSGVDIFYFLLSYEPSHGGYFSPSGYYRKYNDEGEYVENFAYNNRDSMLKNCKEDEHNKDFNNRTCALLIMYDGWQIKDDYPIRL